MPQRWPTPCRAAAPRRTSVLLVLPQPLALPLRSSGRNARSPRRCRICRVHGRGTGSAMAATSAKVTRLTTLALFSPTPTPSGPKSIKQRARAPPPISISMDPALVDPAHLQALMLACAHSCELRLSPALSGSAIEPVDLSKLRTALAHSFIVVTVFCGARFLTLDGEGEWEGQRFLGLELGLERQGERRLVGFGRAVSDLGLTASVHDVVVHPSLQRRGIGRKIVNKITRVLYSRGIYDISALCTEKERPFFEACGFGDDMMDSTAMLYTRKPHR